ncbi:MAG TPA: secretin N-terminal domain-containing protein [Chitinispirillaceae bacterium]|nr:secretin N-terminal domain-containing protein [Chitinispirillaceae bacterium]
MRFRLFSVPFFLFLLVAGGSIQNVSAQTEEKKLTIDVKDTDIKDVIRIISKGYDINILLDQDISGKVTLHLVDVPIMEGLRSIAASNGLEVVQDGAVFKIKKASGEKRSMIRYANDKLTVDVQNMDVKEFLKELSSKTAVSIVPDAKVEGKVTGKLYEVSLDDGLRALLEGNGFKITRRKNIYQVLTSEVSSQPSGGGPRYNSPGASGSSKFRVEYNEGKITLDVSNGDLEDVIRSIAEQSEAEIITYGSLKSEINAKLNDVPLTEALALLLGGTRFTFVQKDNVLLIGDRNTATPSGQALSKSELIHLRHIKADNIPSILPKDIPTTNVRVIKEQNALLISGTSEDIVQAREFLKTIDIPTPQVRIDAVIVEFKDNLDKEFGIRSGRVPALKDSSYIITPFPEHTYYKGYQHFELGMSGKFIKDLWNEMFPKSNWSFIKKALPEDFWTILRFLETQDKAKVLAQPSILTLNGNKASIDVSETQYFKVTTGVNENLTSRFQPIKFGIQLDIVPWISQSGQITAEITPNVSNSEKTNNEGYPNVSTRSITTTVRLNDGETLILGGLVKNQETAFNYKIPILGDIPILGIFFKHSGKTRTKSNLVVFITPHIVTDNPHIDLEREIEKYDLHDKNLIERKIYKSAQKINKALSGSSEKEDLTDFKHVSDSGAVPVEKVIKSSPENQSSPAVQSSPAQPKQDSIKITDEKTVDNKSEKQPKSLQQE